jgi:1-acyl-sn-glycerol-3-phosphate acyltransferase
MSSADVSPAARRMVSLALRTGGWKFEGPVPTIPKYVALAAPHTSNWDGLLLVMLLESIGVEMKWLIKSSWTESPLGPALKRVGAVGVDRSRKTNMVDQMIAEFARRDAFVLAIPPEGTRGRAEHWKSGFYHIARGAQVPVVPGYLDYARKVGGLGAPITMTGDVRADMDAIRAFYAEKQPVAHDPSKFGPIRLREEDEPKAR